MKKKSSIEDYYIFENRGRWKKFLSFVPNRRYTGSYIYVFSPHQPSSFAAFAVLFFLIHYRFPRKHETGSRWLRSINYIFVPYLHDHEPPYLSLSPLFCPVFRRGNVAL